MTNEKKSRELIGCGECESINKCNYKETGINCYAYGIAMKMAEWKDEQYRPIIDDLHEKLKDSVVINNSFGKIINIIKENSPTVDEITDIVNRFNEVKTIEEVKSLYDTISTELKKSNNDKRR